MTPLRSTISKCRLGTLAAAAPPASCSLVATAAAAALDPGRYLTDAAHAEYHELPDCGHNDCPRLWPLLRALLERNGLLR